MPYIQRSKRVRYLEALKRIPVIDTKGELEYCIYWLMQRYMVDKPGRYSTLHDTVYAAQHCADEFRRRNLDPREDAARQENGDVESETGCQP